MFPHFVAPLSLKMETLCIILLALISSSSITHQVQAQDQQDLHLFDGFISLDCGLPSNESSYTERSTGLTYTSDAGFVKSGTIGRIDKDQETGLIKPYTTLRYFPFGTRNCFNMMVTQGMTYAIRAVFVYGNYNGLNHNPKFDLYLGPNIWTTIDFNNIDTWTPVGSDGVGTYNEVVHIPSSNSLEICLVKTGTSTPFISALELRPLRNDAYFTKSGSLRLLSRYYFPDSSNAFIPPIRYPDDVHDRHWNPYTYFTPIKINTTLKVNSANSFELPQAVISKATTLKNASEPLSVGCPSDYNDRVYMYLHFAEIQALRANDTREFDIVWINLNGDTTFINASFRPRFLQIDNIFNPSPMECGGYGCTWDLVKTKRSTLPPIVNAVEAFAIMDLPRSETNPDDVAAIKNIEAMYGLNRIEWQGDPCVPQEFKWKGLDCSYTSPSASPRIISLDLSLSGLRGAIAPSIQNLTQLQKLDLSINKLTGEVPEFLANMQSLSIINLGWNDLDGPVPQALLDRKKKGLKLIVVGNPFCWSEACADGGDNKTKIIVPIIGSAASTAILVAVLFLTFSYRKKRPLRALRSLIVAKKRRFTYSEVTAMTNGFQRVLGEGGFGVVYHGCLVGDEQVAVKVLSQSSVQGYKQFKAEVELLLRVHHTNLVSLVGYCDEGHHLALVYEYIANGDLRKYISGKSDDDDDDDDSALNWDRRLKIAVETASGLEYLHTGCEPQMIHRDVKTTNILLDEHFQAKLADFGLSRSFLVGVESHVSTTVVGTPGYLDPEYHQTNWLTEKSDVYSFGIVLLEIITNQPVIARTREKPHIAEWVGFMLAKGDIETIVDPNLHRDYDSASIWRALELAMSCVNPSSAGRPNMSRVVAELKACLKSETSRNDGSPDMDSKSSLELSLSLGTEVTPKAR